MAPPVRTSLVALLAVLAVGLAGCGGGDDRGTSTAAEAVARWPVWLCRPALAQNWCRVDLTTTVVGADGIARIERVTVPRRRPIDCLYVYPTVNTERRGNADLRIGVDEQVVAIVHAARFEQVCRVFAPLYRQTTVFSSSYGGDRGLAYRDVWRDYVAHWNDGRGVVLIGHSQGARMLEQLLREELADDGARELLVSALLLGGGISVGEGSDRGGDLGDVPRAITPAFPWFNPQGIVPLSSEPPPTGTDWIALPGLYTARCVERGARAWSLVEPVRTPGDPRPLVQEVLDPSSGLHAADVNIALDTLVELVRDQGEAWVASR